MCAVKPDATVSSSLAAIGETLKSAGVSHIVYLPEYWLIGLIRHLLEDPDFTGIAVAREDEGVGLCAGLELGGKKSVLVMQNTGLLASGNAITTLALKHRIPLLMMISHRGAPGYRDAHNYHLLEGEVTRPVLDALRVPVFETHQPDQIGNIAAARERATLANQPVAVLLTFGALVS
jgi:sulfopyruvate decarboxylase subunit alpha